MYKDSIYNTGLFGIREKLFHIHWVSLLRGFVHVYIYTGSRPKTHIQKNDFIICFDGDGLRWKIWNSAKYNAYFDMWKQNFGYIE